MEALQIFSYEGNGVTFRNDSGVLMVNATEMAKSFNKKTVDWLQNNQTQEFITELSKVRKSTLTDLVQVTKGGSKPGTWMHEDVALEFARWLSPSFAIWCNDRIRELLTHGMTATQPTLEDMVNNPDIIIGLAENLKKERAEKERLAFRVDAQQKELVESAPKIEYYDEVLGADGTIVTNIIAKELGMSAVTLNKQLHERGIIYRQGDMWLLYSQHQDKGYAKTRTHTYTNSEGKTLTSIQLVWTQKGREFIHRIMKREAA